MKLPFRIGEDSNSTWFNFTRFWKEGRKPRIVILDFLFQQKKSVFFPKLNFKEDSKQDEKLELLR